MKKNGFTLIEVLSVIVILSLTIIVGFNTLSKSLNNSKEKAYIEQIDRITNVTKTWAIDNIDKLKLSDNETHYLNMSQLLESGIIGEIPLDPRNNNELDGCMKIFHNNNPKRYDYQYKEKEECPSYNDTYNIVYELNGGIVEKENPIIYKLNTPTFTLNNPIKNNFIFSGWSLNDSNEINVVETIYKGSFGDRKYIAHFSEKLHVQIDPNGGTYNGETDFYIEPYGTFNIATPTKEGYEFTGWQPSTEDIKFEENKVILGLTSTKITANWTPINYTITYTLNGGTATNPTSYTIETADFTLNNPTKNGYTFTGWTGSNGDTASKTVTIPKGTTENKAYTANWKLTNYTISYNLNGGTATNPTSYTIETADFTLNNPTKNGYTFTGWTGSNGDTASKTVTIQKGTTGSKSYTANWKINSYTLTVNPNGGTWSSSTSSKEFTLNYNATKTIANPTRTDYVFTGWTVSGTGSTMSGTTFKMGTANATLKANWVSEVYTFSYTGDVQTFKAPLTGYYYVELYGAQGGAGGHGLWSGGPGGAGGKGGYLKAKIKLTADTSYNIYVGGKGESAEEYLVQAKGGYSDGGTGSSSCEYCGWGGGGGGSTRFLKGSTVYARANGGSGGSGGGSGCSSEAPATGGSGGSGGGGTSGVSGGYNANTCSNTTVGVDTAAAGRPGNPGSSYVNTTYATKVSSTDGSRSGNGYAKITYIGAS